MCTPGLRPRIDGMRNMSLYDLGRYVRNMDDLLRLSGIMRILRDELGAPAGSNLLARYQNSWAGIWIDSKKSWVGDFPFWWPTY